MAAPIRNLFPSAATVPNGAPGRSTDTVSARMNNAFARVLKTALRNFNRPDVLGRSPLRRPNPLTAGARDQKLRRVIEISYFRPAILTASTRPALPWPCGIAFHRRSVR